MGPGGYPTYGQKNILSPCTGRKGALPLAVQVNQPAPGFELSALVGTKFQKIKLSDYKGTWVVLFFYPLDFTPV